MTKNTKIALGVAALAALFLAYKKGVFGGKTESETKEPTTPKTTAKEAAKDVSTTKATDVIQTAVTERPMPVVPSMVSTPAPQVIEMQKQYDVVKTGSRAGDFKVVNTGVVTATNAPNPLFTSF